MRLTLGKSISARLITTLLIILVIGQAVGAYLFLTSIRLGFMDSLHSRMTRQAKQAAGVLGEAAVTYNTSLIESYINEAMKDRDIVAIRVLDKSGAVVKEQSAQHGTKKVFTVTEPLLFVGEAVGNVRVEYAAKTIDDSMLGSLVLIPLYQGAMLVVVAIVFIRLFTSYVKRPVEELNRAIAGITGGDLGIEVPVSRDDEIGSIAMGVKFLAERLSGTITRINSISGKVAEAVHELTDTFERVRDVIEKQNQSTQEVSEAVRGANATQQHIVSNTEQLLALSGDNLSTLLQMRASSEEIAGTTDSLAVNLQSSYDTLQELAQSAGEVTRMADEVATFVAESSSCIEEVYRSVKNVETMINESSRLSTQTTTVISGKGMDAVAAVMAGMKRIGGFIDTHMVAIERLGDRSRDIDKILGVIEDVTAKSRLLSLNAQILAAQSGEHGKGFSVVAEEMKQLSDKAALSTREIADIVNAIQQEIGDVVKDSRDSVDVVREGEKVVANTTSVLDEILTTARQATTLAEGIELAAGEQTTGLKQAVSTTELIRDRIGEVNRATMRQEKSTTFLLDALKPVREGMEFTRRSTGEQAHSSVSIAGNIEQANQKNADISVASANQQKLNQRVLDALHAVVHMGHSTVSEVNRLLPQVTAMREELESLRLEMAVFRNRQEPSADTP